MEQTEQEKIVFWKKIIRHGRALYIRKAAEAYWSAYKSEEGASDEVGKKLEQAIKSIPIDYRQPTLKHLEELKSCNETNDDTSACYLNFAIRIVDRIISTL